MKAFRFRLERVLSWRGTQLTLAEAKAEHLLLSLRMAAEAMAEVTERLAAAQANLGRAPLSTGAELAVFENSRVWSIREQKRLEARMMELRQSITAQNCCVAEARRGVKLVERLKERKYDAWKTEAAHEIDELAAESAIAQWRRVNP